jgi:hypothetical protein
LKDGSRPVYKLKKASPKPLAMIVWALWNVQRAICRRQAGCP